jgi:hypothetical protein
VIGIDNTKKPIASITINDSTVSEPIKIAQHFNKYFSSIGNNLASSLPINHLDPMRYMNPNAPRSLFLSPVTSNELYTIIFNLKDASAGIDDIKPITIKEFSQSIIKPLLHIFNLSFTQGSVPCAMKKANVTPIFKGAIPLPWETTDQFLYSQYSQKSLNNKCMIESTTT